MRLLDRFKRHRANVIMRGAAWEAYQNGLPDLAIEIQNLADLAMTNPAGFRELALPRRDQLPPASIPA